MKDVIRDYQHKIDTEIPHEQNANTPFSTRTVGVNSASPTATKKDLAFLFFWSCYIFEYLEKQGLKIIMGHHDIITKLDERH
jgi:hypothetical protein